MLSYVLIFARLGQKLGQFFIHGFPKISKILYIDLASFVNSLLIFDLMSEFEIGH